MTRGVSFSVKYGSWSRELYAKINKIMDIVDLLDISDVFLGQL